MAEKIIATPEQLRKLLRYDPDSGLLFWRFRDSSFFRSDASAAAWNGKHANKIAFTAEMIGYKVGTIFGRRHLAHRVAWAIYHGEWPADQIDHINGVRSDNRLINMRQSTQQENCCNMPRQSNNTSGYKGVRRYRDGVRWQAVINHLGKPLWLGLYATAEDAHAAYCEAAQKYHGEFARTE